MRYTFDILRITPPPLPPQRNIPYVHSLVCYAVRLCLLTCCDITTWKEMKWHRGGFGDIKKTNSHQQIRFLFLVNASGLAFIPQVKAHDSLASWIQVRSDEKHSQRFVEIKETSFAQNFSSYYLVTRLLKKSITTNPRFCHSQGKQLHP